MKRSSVCVLAIGFLLTLWACPLIGSALAQPAFPGAVGFGSTTPGGRGGRVIAVTNLNDSGTGSFRAAVEASGARIIVFRTGGTIRLSRNVVIRNPYLTIAGQTAPGGGIALRGAGLSITTHDVIVRGLRIRVGDDAGGPSPDNRDNLMIENINGNLARVVIDHCSFSWAIDESVSIWHRGARDITISNSIISESLRNSLHSKGPHSMSLVMGYGTRNVTLYGNLFAHSVERNPLLQGTNAEFINNVVYNRGKVCVAVESGTEAQHVSIIGNYFRKGPSYTSNTYPIRILEDRIFPGTQVRIVDNIGTSYRSGSLASSTRYLTDRITFTGSGTPARPASQVFNWVLANAGANPQRPDPVDARIIRETRDGTGRIIDNVSQVGGWPTLASGTAPIDSDGDGMPDSWEIARGLNPNGAADANRDRNGDGYTNIEEYINSFYDSSSASNDLKPPVLRIVGN
jgi:pectate lyase